MERGCQSCKMRPSNGESEPKLKKCGRARELREGAVRENAERVSKLQNATVEC